MTEIRSRRPLVGLVLLGGSLAGGFFHQVQAAPAVRLGNPTTVEQHVRRSSVEVEASYGRSETPGKDHVTVTVRPTVGNVLVATEVGPHVTTECNGPVTSKVCLAIETLP